MITPTSMDQLLYVHRSNDLHTATCSSKSLTVNNPTYSHISKRDRFASIPTLRSAYDNQEQEYRTNATSCRLKRNMHPGSLSAPLGLNRASTLPSDIAPNPSSHTALGSPSLKKRPSYSKRSQKSAHRATVRRIISESHHHNHHHQLHDQQQQQHSRLIVPVHPFSSRTLSLSASSQLGAATEAILQDEIRSNVHPYLFSSQDHPPPLRPRLRIRCKNLSTSEKQMTIHSAPPISRPCSSWSLPQDRENNRRHSAAADVWMNFKEYYFSHIEQHDAQKVYSQLHQQRPHQYQVLLSGRSRRRSVCEVISSRRCPSMHSLPSASLLRRDGGQRTSSLLRQRRRILRCLRHQATRQSSLVCSTSKCQVCLKWTDRSLPPIPTENKISGKQYIGEEFTRSDKCREAESGRTFTVNGEEEILSVVNQDVRSDHHCPLTDDSKKIQLMETKRDMSHCVSTLPAKTEIEQDTLTFSHPILPTPARTSSISQPESLRFPIKVSLIEKKASERFHLHYHNRHQSLPYNRTQSRFLSEALEVHAVSPSEITQHTRSSSMASVMSSTCLETLPWLKSGNVNETDQGSHEGVIIVHNTSTNNITGKQTSVPKRRRRHGSQRLTRSESSGAYCRRPSLSLISPKKALLNVQYRRVFKPHAKIHRLPGTKPTATSTPALATAATSVYSTELSNARRNSETTGSDLLLLCSNTPNIATRFENQATNSVGEEGIVETTLKESNTSEDTIQSREQRRGLDETMGTESSNEPDTDNYVLTTGPQDQTPIDPVQCITKVEFGLALSSAFETLSIDPRPELDAKETKRFIKRSHALKELETTEESYVNDLDVLLNVYLRVLETKPWFPQNIQVKMCRCVNGLLAMHRNFHSRIEAGVSRDSDHEGYLPLRVYRSLAESIKILSRDNYLYSAFCELRMRTVNEINKSAGQATMTLLQRECKDLMLQQGRLSSRSDLKDFLIKPIQRICRYPLLLEEILRLTNENDPEYQYIEQAYQLMKGKAQEMDENQKVVERRLLTEQFLKKLPDTSFPRKMGLLSSKEQPSSSDMNLGNNTSINSSIHSYQATSGSIHHDGNGGRLTFNSDLASDNCLDFGSGPEGFNPAALTKAFAGTLGSIILAGALEYVITPDMHARLKYYGCILFETMLIVVKVKKSNLYEPRQWLPLRFCELHETTKLDGYTQFGWRIMFDQFQIYFGADSVAEQQVWINTLQDRIWTAKEAYIRLPREITTFETVVSSLPWKANSSFAAGHMNTRQQQISHKSPLFSPSHWSSCSSAIPLPLMPPPPSVSSSTMMMAMSSMVTIEPEKWNFRGYGQTIGSHNYRQDLCPPDHRLESKFSEKVRESSVGNHEVTRIGGMTSNWSSGKEVSPQNRCFLSPLNAHDYRTRSEPQLLNSSTQVPRFLYGNRPKNNTFDVARAFASSNNSIKRSQRIFVQSLFKDVSTEHIWASSAAVQPSPQSASVLSRHNSSNSLSDSQPIATPSSPQMNTSGAFSVPSAWDSSDSVNLLGEDSYASVHVTRSPSSSLTSQVLRRRGSEMGVQILPSGAAGNLDKSDWGQQRNSATSTIAGTLSLNFQKNSDPQQHRHRRCSSSIVETGMYGPESQEGAVSSGDGCEAPAILTQESYSLLSSVTPTEDCGDDHSEGPPFETGKEILDTLKNVGEAARSRRGNSDRVLKNSALRSSSSQSLPARLRSTSSSAISLLASPSIEAPKENAERIWSAMGRIIPKRVSSNGSNHTNLPMDHVGDSISSTDPFPNQRQLHQQQPNVGDSQEHCALHEEVLFQNKQPSPMNATDSGRTSTRNSRSTVTSRNSSLGYSDDTRTGSTGSSHSMDSNMRVDGSEATLTLSAPLRPALTTFVSASNCSAKTQDNGQPANITEYRPPLPMTGSDRNSKVVSKPKLVYQPQGQRRPDSLPSTSSQGRRKSLSIFQNITNSASQKFRSLIRSQNGPKRRTVMGLSPMTMECSSSLDDLVAKKATEEKDRGCENETMV